ncbi:MAG TPA: hypothetical protein VHF05_01790, partial [Candidatus Paceibacterota bacterium]|nr:hypothetical protein [Candidatus Paceibacterota bacterium]
MIIEYLFDYSVDPQNPEQSLHALTEEIPDGAAVMNKVDLEVGGEIFPFEVNSERHWKWRESRRILRLTVHLIEEDISRKRIRSFRKLLRQDSRWLVVE